MVNSKLLGWMIAIGIDRSIICEYYHLDKHKEKAMSFFSKTQKWIIHNKNKV